MNKKYAIIFGIIALTNFVACNNNIDTTEEFDFGYDYHPLEVGKYIDYQIDSIIFDPVDSRIVRDTSSVLVREIIVDSYKADDDQEIFVIERLERETNKEDWRFKSNYATYRTDFQLFRTEENLTFLKMIFPLTRGNNWEGINFDKTKIVNIAGENIEMFKNWSTIITGVNEPLNIGNFSFDEVTTIQLARDTNAIELRSAYEQYAKGIGLVYRELSILNTQNIAVDDDVLWEDKAEEGFLLYQRIIDHN